MTERFHRRELEIPTFWRIFDVNVMKKQVRRTVLRSKEEASPGFLATESLLLLLLLKAEPSKTLQPGIPCEI